MASVPYSTQGEIRTTSRFRVWWLCTFRGYTVKSRSRTPRAILFGRVQYNTEWVLSPA